jgi:membrane protease YdiL (CAAX protease family)
LPIVVFLGYIGLHLQRWLPGGEHPVQNMILQPSAHIPILISGGLLAAVMEETAFRGFFFQGLLVRFRHVGWAIFFSSLAFASIHPQGITLWPVLGWIGATGAYLTRERQSLIPAVVMHALHNSVLLAISIYAS